VNPEPFFAVLDWIEHYAADLERIGGNPPSPRWDQDWFPRLDAAAAYALVRSKPPRRIVEVGSGHSTRFMARAVKDAGLATRITAIDPEPRAKINGLDIEYLQSRVQDAAIPALEPNDILFIDSSHQNKAGSDVELLFNKVIPLLPSAVAALLQAGWRADFSSHWVVSRRADLVRRGVLGRLPLVDGALESSLWLTKN
jgi:hypothetical protein